MRTPAQVPGVLSTSSPDDALKATPKRPEVPELRTEYSRTYREENGTLTAEIYREPVNYRDEHGNMIPVDTAVLALQSQPEGFIPQVAERYTDENGMVVPVDPPTFGLGSWTYANRTNPLRSYYDGNGALVRADGINSSVVYGIEGMRYRDGNMIDTVSAAGSAQPFVDGRTVLYSGVFGGVDVLYDVKEYGVVQRIVFSSAPRPPASPLSAANAKLGIGESIRLSAGTRIFDAKGKAITANGTVNGSIQIRAGQDDVLWMNAPFAFDSSGRDGVAPKMSPGAFHIEFQSNGSIMLWSEIPYSFFADPLRRYPVTIDPTLSLQPDPAAGKDSQLAQAAPTSNFGTRQWLTDNFGAIGDAGIIQFDLTSIPVGSTVNSANLSIYHEFNSDPTQWGVYRNLAAWDEMTVTWNNAPATDPVPLATWFPGAPNTTDVINVTTAVAAQVAGQPNFGWRLTRVILPGPGNWSYYRSSDDLNAATRPKIDVNYNAAGGCGGGGTLTLQPDPAAGIDSQLAAAAPTSNFGTRQWLTDNFGAIDDAGIIQFDLSSIPATATVTSATLSIYHEFNTDTGGNWGVYRNLAAWNENTVTYNNAPAFSGPDATWLPGAPGTTDNIDVKTIVQAHVNGTVVNNGWRLTRVVRPGPGNWCYYRSSDDVNVLTRPKLVVQFTGAGGGPGSMNVEPDAVVGKDSQLAAAAPTSNFGTRQWLTDNFGAIDDAGIIQFDLTPIPAGATITSASLTLYHEFNSDTSQWGIFRNLAAWDENTVTYNNAPPFNPVPDNTWLPGPPGFNEVIPATQSLQAIINAGQNFGWRLTRVVRPGPGNWTYYRSSDVNPAGTRPRLIAAWTAAGGGGQGSITCPPNQNANNDPGRCGAIVPYPPATAKDACGNPIPVVCNPAPGTFFGVGATQVTCTAAGNLSCQFLVTVRDVEPPVLVGVPADLRVQCDAVPNPPNVTATDNCPPVPAVVYSQTRTNGNCPYNYVLNRRWSATDASNNNTTANRTVTVEDTVAPVVMPGVDNQYCLWSPEHQYVCFTASDFNPNITDNCSTVIAWDIDGCTSDQPDDTTGDGSTIHDCVVNADQQGFCVRAERRGPEPPGRHYAVSVVATDECGNASGSTGINNVYIPHDQDPHETCIDPNVSGCGKYETDIPCAR